MKVEYQDKLKEYEQSKPADQSGDNSTDDEAVDKPKRTKSKKVRAGAEPNADVLRLYGV